MISIIMGIMLQVITGVGNGNSTNGNGTTNGNSGPSTTTPGGTGSWDDNGSATVRKP